MLASYYFEDGTPDYSATAMAADYCCAVSFAGADCPHSVDRDGLNEDMFGSPAEPHAPTATKAPEDDGLLF